MTDQDAPAPAQDGEDELAVLHPDVTLDIAGRTITVREYRFIDGLRARAKGKPLIDDITAMLESGKVLDAVTEDYVDMLARHDLLIRDLMADAIDGADRDWIDGLSDDDGQVLLLNWWGVCGRFFVRVVVRKLAEQAAASTMRAAGSKSLTHLSGPAMERSATSNATSPSVN